MLTFDICRRGRYLHYHIFAEKWAEVKIQSLLTKFITDDHVYEHDT